MPSTDTDRYAVSADTVTAGLFFTAAHAPTPLYYVFGDLKVLTPAEVVHYTATPCATAAARSTSYAQSRRTASTTSSDRPAQRQRHDASGPARPAGTPSTPRGRHRHRQRVPPLPQRSRACRRSIRSGPGRETADRQPPLPTPPLLTAHRDGRNPATMTPYRHHRSGTCWFSRPVSRARLSYRGKVSQRFPPLLLPGQGCLRSREAGLSGVRGVRRSRRSVAQGPVVLDRARPHE